MGISKKNNAQKHNSLKPSSCNFWPHMHCLQALGVGAGEASRPDQASFVEARRSLKRRGKDRVPVKSREWILAKKARAQRQGKE